MKQIPCFIETRTKKDGSGSFEVIVIKLTESYEKLVFLDTAEKELLKLVSLKNESNK